MNPRKKSQSVSKCKHCVAICTSMSKQCIALGNGQQVSVTAFPIVSAKKQNKTRGETGFCSSMTVYLFIPFGYPFPSPQKYGYWPLVIIFLAINGRTLFFFFSNIVFSSEKDRTQTYFVTTLRDHRKTVNTRLALNVWEKEWSWENCRNGFRSVLKLKWMTEPEMLKRNHVPLCSTFILWLWGRVSDRMCLKGLKLGNLMLKVWQRASNYILGRCKKNLSI